MLESLLQESPAGLYCPQGDFYVDPWRRVPRAVITHAHADHARTGMDQYLTTEDGHRVLRRRVGNTAHIDTIPYGTTLTINGVRVSLHPAGHVLGSAQVRIEYRGYVVVISGDYKVLHDATCRPFEPVRCNAFVSECTFGLPVFRWPNPDEVFGQINQWWRQTRDRGETAVIFAYSLGKAQRILKSLDPFIGPIVCHRAVEELNEDYRDTGVTLPETTVPDHRQKSARPEGAIIIAPPAVQDSSWLKPFGICSMATASGWMMIRGTRRWMSVDRGFVLSDHADWPGLLKAISATGAEKVLVTHGRTGPMVRWLREKGIDSNSLSTKFTGESQEADSGESLP